MSSSSDTTTTGGSDAGGPVALLARIDAVLEEVNQRGLWPVSDAELLGLSIAVENTRRRLEATRLSVIAEVSNRDLARHTGSRSTATWLVEKTRIGRAEARRVVRAAQRLAHHAPAVRDALAAGTIGIAHATVIADLLSVLHERATRHASPVTWEVMRAAEATMLDLAATLDPGQLATAGAHLIDRVDPEFTPYDEHDPDGALAAEAQREFRLTTHPDGSSTFTGGADPEGTAIIQAALSPLSAPRPTTAEGPDRRSAPRRQGDALVELARRQLNADDQPSQAGGAGSPGGPGNTVFVTCTDEALRAQLTRAEADGQAPVLDFGTEIPVESLRRMACDAWIIPAVLATTSQPLDIGRASRLVPTGMHRALIARDHHCAFPGCTLPPAWCDAHHVVFWRDGGPTALNNLVLLCGHHHRVIHHTAWTCVIADDGLPAFHPPDWLNPDLATADPTWRVTINQRHPRQPRAG